MTDINEVSLSDAWDEDVTDEPRVDFYGFRTWLHTLARDAVVGKRRRAYHSTIGNYLRSQLGDIYSTSPINFDIFVTVDCYYLPIDQQRQLPLWAKLFCREINRHTRADVTALEALRVLAQIEVSLTGAQLREE